MSKVAVITGSSGELGTELVNIFIDDGYLTIGLDILPRTKNYNKRFHFIETDLSVFPKDYKYRTCVIESIKELIPDDVHKIILINNAAQQILNKFDDIKYNDWYKSFAVNTLSPFFLTQGLFEQLKHAQGHVLNISSIHAKLTKSSFTCYAASKTALESITKSLALEISEHGISVNAVAPAAINTKMLKSGFKNNKNKLDQLNSFHPSKSIGEVADTAQFIKLIAENKNSFLTGSIIELNGGISSRLHDPD